MGRKWRQAKGPLQLLIWAVQQSERMLKVLSRKAYPNEVVVAMVIAGAHELPKTYMEFSRVSFDNS